MDGALALRREPESPPGGLRPPGASASVSGMARPEAYFIPLAGGPARRARARARLRLLVLVAVLLAGLATGLVIAFGGSDAQPVTVVEPPAPAARLLPGGAPKPQVIALQSDLRIYLPIDPARVTAIGYHATGEGALPFDPVGKQDNAGTLTKLRDRIFGEDIPGGVRYVLIAGGTGPDTGGLDIGATVGTNVFAPVDGTILGISDVVVQGAPYGQRIDIQPAGSPGMVVTLTRVLVDPEVAVGRTVSASKTRIGTVADFSSVEQSALARFTQDTGQHVHIEARRAASSLLP